MENDPKLFLRLHQHRAMTLIEMLLVISIVSMLSIGLYKALNSGLQVWERSQQIVVEEDIALFLDKITRDLKNSYLYSSIRFEGTEEAFSFPTIIKFVSKSKSRNISKEEMTDQMGKVEYFFNPDKKTIEKREFNYRQALDKKSDAVKVVAASVEALKFAYFYFMDDGGMYSQKALDTIPAGIDVEILFFDKKGQRLIHKFIDVPIGG